MPNETVLSDAAEETEYQEFVIDSPGKADWAVGIIKAERERRDLYIAAAQDRIDELGQKIKTAREACDQKTGYLMSLLDGYLDAVQAKKTKTQLSLALPSGKLVRTLPKAVMTYDEDALLAYAKTSAAEYVETKEKVKWGELKKDLAIADGVVVRISTGEVLDCIAVEEKPAEFDVK